MDVIFETYIPRPLFVQNLKSIEAFLKFRIFDLPLPRRPTPLLDDVETLIFVILVSNLVGIRIFDWIRSFDVKGVGVAMWPILTSDTTTQKYYITYGL